MRCVLFSSGRTCLGQECIIQEQISSQKKKKKKYCLLCRRSAGGAVMKGHVFKSKREWLTLTFDSEDHALTDVWAHAVGGLTEVVASIILQDVPDEQRAVWHDLDPAGQRDRVVLLRVSHTCTTQSPRCHISVIDCCADMKGDWALVLPLACFHMTFGGG